MARTRTDATERNQQNARLVGRASKEAGVAVSRRGALAATTYPKAAQRLVHPKTPDDSREFIVRGITESITKDRELDFRQDEVRFVGDIIVEVNDMKTYRGGTVTLNVQTTDDFLDTITDAIRLSRGHPLFCRLFELFPKPASPWADGTHPDDPHPATPGMPHSLNGPKEPQEDD